MAASASTPADVAVKSASPSTPSGSKALLWVLLLVIIVLFAYQRMASEKEQVIDQNYYRILYETANSFTIRLEQLRRLNKYNANANVIRAQFPSFSGKLKPDAPLQFSLQNGLLYLQNDCWLKEPAKTEGEKQAESTCERANVAQDDVLSRPKGGFSLLLITDQTGKVLARSGEENAVSFSRLDYVIQALTETRGFSLANMFKADTANKSERDKPKMPGASRHVEVDLSYGRYRVYLYPLPPSDSFGTVSAEQENLYIIGLLPDRSFAAQKHDVAGFKLMLLSVASLLFLWTFLKVCLMPQHQAVPRWLISLCYLSSFAIFALLVAAISVYFLQHAKLEQKTQQAKHYASTLNAEVSAEITSAFTALAEKEDFFHGLATALHSCSEASDWDCIAKRYQCRLYGEQPFQNIDEPTCPISSLGGNYSLVGHKVDETQSHLAGDSKNAPGWKLGVFPASFAVTQLTDRTLSSQLSEPVVQNHILNTTVISKEGISRWPAVYFIEHNSNLKPFSLAHREYFKRVKTNTGWTLPFRRPGTEADFTNVYIQRLLNIDSGTRGTTMSMPVRQQNAESLAGAVLIGDVFLPSLNVKLPPQQDFTYMVVDKASGAILYHSDNSRSMIENAYFAGPDASAVKDFVQSQNQTDTLDDHYHGLAGRFVKQDMIVPDWQLLVFFPANSLTLYNLVWFVILTIVPFLSLSLSWFCLNVSRIDTAEVKAVLGLPKRYRRRWLFLQMALLLCMICAACSIYLANQQFSCWQLLLWLLLGWLIIFGSSYLLLSERRQQIRSAVLNSSRIYALLLVLCLPLIWYLSQVQAAPEQALQHYYRQWQMLQLEQEQQELRQSALYLYPNTTTQHLLSAQEVLQIDIDFDELIEQSRVASANMSSVTGLPVLSSGSGYAYFWQLIDSLLFNFSAESSLKADSPLPSTPAGYVTNYLLAMLALLCLFVLYVEHMLGARLCLSSAALYQLSRLVRISATDEADVLSENLTIEFKSVSLQGFDISAVLQADAHNFSPQLKLLLLHSKVLSKWQKDSLALPSLKLHLQYAADNKLHVTLSDIEVCLEKRKSREHLLQLLQELKALVIAQRLAGLTLKSGFHSFQHLAVKDAFKPADQHDELDHTEYLLWSECLMDFKVSLPDKFKQELDPLLLRWEARWSPHIMMLVQQDGIKLPEEKNVSADKGWYQRFFRGTPREGAILAVQSYVLCHADAFYRFKWENCTKDEQLALYNLALGHQLNPLNITMMQNLALNGLLRVHRGQLKLVNNSFQQFVLNAEPQHKLQALVREGEAGVWQQHRITFAAVILTLMVGIAMTSGQSLHIIAVSVAGVLSTLVNVFSNASLLRSQFR